MPWRTLSEALQTRRSDKMRFRPRKTLQYLFLLLSVLLIWREFEWISNNQDANSGPAGAGGNQQPLVAGIQPQLQPQRPGARGVGGDGGGGIHGGAWGREPLWQDNRQMDPELLKLTQREVLPDLDSRPDSDASVNNSQQKSAKNRTHEELLLKIYQSNISKNKWKDNHNSSDERSVVQQESPKVLSVKVSEPIVVKGEANPLVRIKDLSSLVANRPVAPANITIIVQNPGNIPSKPQRDKQTELSDVFIGVKTTEKYHRDRLQIILDTWFSLAPEQTNFFTDVDDVDFQQKTNGHMINTQCQGTHSRMALCCKTSVMFNMFLRSTKRWLCHVDDDNYLNVPELLKLLRQYDHNQDHYLGRASLSHPIEAIDRDSNQRVSFWFATGGAGFCISKSLANKMAVYASSGTFERMCNRIRLPDDVTIGFIIEVLLKKPLTKVQTFNSHLQQLRSIPTNQLRHQITLSYSITEKRVNVINMPSPTFKVDQDPTRFKAFHCAYFRGFGNCPL